MVLLSHQNILLSISILISNRPGTVEKCLKSLESLRRQIPSELILVDTGCGEQVRKMIEPYADKIVNFAWCNDFAKARNAGLKQAKGEWFLYLDDDEWFENTKEIENFFLSDQHLHYNYGSYLVRNYLNPEGGKYRDEYVGRLIRLEPDTEFVHSVHEHFSRARTPWIRLHSYVHHYGYAFKNEEEARRHGQRNIELLLAEHKKEPKELRHNAQLVQEYNALKEWEKSIEISWDGILNAESGIATEQFLGGLYVNIVRNYVVLEQYCNAIEAGEKYLDLDHSNEVARAALCYNLCIAYLETKEHSKSLEMAEWYLEFYRKWKEDRDATAFYEYLSIAFLSEGCKQAALCIGVQNEIILENAALAKKYFDEIDWSILQAMLETQGVQCMIHTLVRVWLSTDADLAQDYTAMMRCLLQNRALTDMVVAELNKLQKSMPELLQTKKADWMALANEHWIFLYYKLRNRVDTDRDILTEDYCNLWTEPRETLMRARDLGLWEMAQKDGVDMECVICGIPLYRWKKAAELAVEKLEWQDVQEMQRQLQKVLNMDSFHMLYWSIPYRIRKIRIMTADKDGKEKNKHDFIENIVQELLVYAMENKCLYGKLFREELLGETTELLSLGYQMSLKLTDMVEAVEKGDFQRSLENVKEALEIMPELSDALKCCIQWISDKSETQNREQEKARDEMKRLAEAVKGQVRGMAVRGMLPEALGILQQLKTLVPEDEEVEQLEQMLRQMEK